MGLSFGLLCVTHPDVPIASERWLNKGDLLLSQAVHLWRKDPALARRLLEPLHSNLGREITWWLAEHPRCELELQDGNFERHPLLPPLEPSAPAAEAEPEPEEPKVVAFAPQMVVGHLDRVDKWPYRLRVQWTGTPAHWSASPVQVEDNRAVCFVDLGSDPQGPDPHVASESAQKAGLRFLSFQPSEHQNQWVMVFDHDHQPDSDAPAHPLGLPA